MAERMPVLTRMCATCFPNLPERSVGPANESHFAGLWGWVFIWTSKQFVYHYLYILLPGRENRRTGTMVGLASCFTYYNV